MSRFIGRFYKCVLGDNGRIDDVCQGTIELDAADEGHAADVAKQRFCHLHGVNDWTLHADRIDVKPADFPS
jgi:hypothetical protein